MTHYAVRLRRARFVLAVFSGHLKPLIQIIKSEGKVRLLGSADEAVAFLRAEAERDQATRDRRCPAQQLMREASFVVAVTGTRIDILKDRDIEHGHHGPWIGCTFDTAEIRLRRAVMQSMLAASDCPMLEILWPHLESTKQGGRSDT